MSINDNNIDDYLQGDSELSRLYQQTKTSAEGVAAEPDVNIDAALQAAARKATQSRPGMNNAPFSGKWQVPASLAAILVISVGIVDLIGPDAEVSVNSNPTGLFDDNANVSVPESEPLLEKSLSNQQTVPSQSPAISINQTPSAESPQPVTSLPSGSNDPALESKVIAEQRQQAEQELNSRRREKQRLGIAAKKKMTIDKTELPTTPNQQKPSLTKRSGVDAASSSTKIRQQPAAVQHRATEELLQSKEADRSTNIVLQDTTVQSTTPEEQTLFYKQLFMIRLLREKGDLAHAIKQTDQLISQYGLLSTVQNKSITSGELSEIISELKLQGREKLARQLEEKY